MPPSKKQNKKSKNKLIKKKNVNNKSLTTSSVITEEQKEFYLDQINSLEPRLIRYVFKFHLIYRDFYNQPV
jgi:hypothetical protein